MPEELTPKKSVLSVRATVSNRLPELVIKDGQLIFVQDKHRIALDFDGKRVFYNQIEELDSDMDRFLITDPEQGVYYFVIETAVLWTYRDGWVQVTTPPDEIVFIGTEMPELGLTKTLYVDKTNKAISVWDESTESYMVVADKTDVSVEINIEDISRDDINKLFA